MFTMFLGRENKQNVCSRVVLNILKLVRVYLYYKILFVVLSYGDTKDMQT